MRRLDQFRALAAWERRLLVQLVLLLPVIELSLRLLGYARTKAWLDKNSRVEAGPSVAQQDADRLAYLVSIASRHGFYRATCLRQALALSWCLRRRGLPAELRFGVRKAGQGLQAHAWVECGGRAVYQAEDVAELYAVLESADAVREAPKP